MYTVYNVYMNKELLAYTAGFVDGEGYIGIKKYIRSKTKKWSPMYSERVSVAGISEKSIRNLNDIVKGYVVFHKKSKLSKRGYWSWEVTENNARIFLNKIIDYLVVKKPEAEIVLKLSENKIKTNRKKISDEDIQYRDSLYLKIKELHTYKEV